MGYCRQSWTAAGALSSERMRVPVCVAQGARRNSSASRAPCLPCGWSASGGGGSLVALGPPAQPDPSVLTVLWVISLKLR